jgi:hypothetical protein
MPPVGAKGAGNTTDSKVRETTQKIKAGQKTIDEDVA